ncbi:glycosyltransferase family 2 protein [Gammaproteobacteria bacterium]|nr:glycosyltransferase family 2 protein [Gammaproteobacteria bacterium]
MDVHISVVSPIYRGEKMLDELVERLHQNLSSICTNYEIILVNDASPDNSWSKIESICQNDPKVKGLNLSRNFGQHYAITAGLNYARGEWMVVMDCDLQDRPEEIIHLYRKAQEGFDSVFAQRVERQDNFLKKLSSKLFYFVFSYLTETKQDATIGNFGIYSRKVINAILCMHDQVRYFPTMVKWVGFKQFAMPIEHAERAEGTSSYSFKALINLALNNIIAFSDKPLRLAAKCGFYISLISLIIGIIYIYRYFNGYIHVLGYASMIISIWFIGGIIMSLSGILGIYLGKIFDRVKDRPTYIVSESLNIIKHEDN